MMQLRRTEFVGEKLSTNVQTEIGSTQCISRLTESIIYNIYYERRLLPEHFFVTRLIEGIPVKELVPGASDRRILKLNKWIADLLRSIEKKQLRNACVELVTKHDNKIIESYCIKYSYRDESRAKNIPEQYTTSGIQTMLKNMKNIFKNKLTPVIDVRNLRFKLTADTTGGGIESSVFATGRNRTIEFNTEDEKVEIEVGTVCTPYHRLILRLTADVQTNPEEDPENDVIIIEDNSQVSPKPEIIELDDYPDEDVIQASVSSSIQTVNMETESSKLYSTIREMSNLKLACICNTQLRDQLFTIMQCKNCSTYQHAECYGIHKTGNIPWRHICHDCSCLLIESQEHNAHTDPRLVEFTINELKEIGRMRLILMYIFREKRCPLNFIKKHFAQDLEKTVEKLIKCKILVQKRDNFKMDLHRVNIFIRRHFKPKYSINKYF